MGLKITRLQRDQATRLPAPPSVSTNTSSIWSARDLCPLELLGNAEPTFLERVSPDASGHLGAEQISQLFDRLWTLAGDRRRVIAQLDMTDVKTTDPRFTGELGFFRRQLQRQGGSVRVINFE